MQNAAFSFLNYVFDYINFDLSKIKGNEIGVNFEPKGEYDESSATFQEIVLVTIYSIDNEANPFITMRCKAHFKFSDKIGFSQIPDYFYSNSLAILFPYLRAYVSIITTQSNSSGLILPTLNLTSLESELKKKTILKKA